MSSPEKIAANRRNSLQSTGPATEEGKAASSQNARTHGLASKQFVILDGQQEEFDSFSSDLRSNIQPLGAFEDELFLQLLHAAWNLRRCRLAEAELAKDATVDPLLDDTNEAKLRRIDIYARRSRADFNRVLKDLRIVQTERQFRTEVQTPDEFPDPAECMRGSGALIDFTRIEREMRARRTADESSAGSSDDMFKRFAPQAELLAGLHRR